MADQRNWRVRIRRPSGTTDPMSVKVLGVYRTRWGATFAAWWWTVRNPWGEALVQHRVTSPKPRSEGPYR